MIISEHKMVEKKVNKDRMVKMRIKRTKGSLIQRICIKIVENLNPSEFYNTLARLHSSTCPPKVCKACVSHGQCLS
jgi:hypothetical protein